MSMSDGAVERASSVSRSCLGDLNLGDKGLLCAMMLMIRYLR